MHLGVWCEKDLYKRDYVLNTSLKPDAAMFHQQMSSRQEAVVGCLTGTGATIVAPWGLC